MTSPFQSLTPRLQTELQQQRLRDLAQRCWPGIILFPLIWWCIALPRLWYAPTEQNFSWLAGVGFATLLLSGIRLRLLKNLRQRMAREATCQEWEITLGVFLNSGFWGIIIAVSLLDSPLAPLSISLLAATAGLCAGGIASLAISARVVLVFLACMLFPSLLVIFLGYSSQPAELAFVLLVFWAGMFWVSSLPRKEYLDALVSRLQLNLQAAILEEMSNTDALTGLMNQRAFEQELAAELRRATRNQHPVSLLLISIDQLRQLQEQEEDNLRERCLQSVTQQLRVPLKRATDMLARYGEEEFAVILPATDQPDALKIAEMLRQSVAACHLSIASNLDTGDKLETVDKQTRFSISVGGVTLVPALGTLPRDLTKLAASALYSARDGGGDQIKFAASGEAGSKEAAGPREAAR